MTAENSSCVPNLAHASAARLGVTREDVDKGASGSGRISLVAGKGDCTVGPACQCKHAIIPTLLRYCLPMHCQSRPAHPITLCAVANAQLGGGVDVSFGGSSAHLIDCVISDCFISSDCTIGDCVHRFSAHEGLVRSSPAPCALSTLSYTRCGCYGVVEG